ncbi:MAG: tRNA (adenosine(37)-N6)-dimethylallyltransferase MiaA, partial [Bdellovibrionales bacterium GWC1_52_8]
HLLDIKNPDESFTAGAFVREVEEKLIEIHSRGTRALIVGGTGFYLKALLFGQWNAPAADPLLRAEFEKKPTEALFTRLAKVDPQAAERIGPQDRYRLVRALEINQATGKTLTSLQAELPSAPDPRFALLVLDRPTEELDVRIHERTEQMIRAGLIEEVTRLLESFPAARTLNAVGYRQAVAYLRDERPAGRKIAPGLPGLVSEIELATRQLVKQQRTWFRSQTYAQSFSLEQNHGALLEKLSEILR